jgi:hypothetical protein
MNDIIKEIALALDNQIRGDQTMNGNLTADQINVINEFVSSYNETMGTFPFPLKRR